MLQDLLVRPPSMRTTGLMGLKPLRQRQEHDRRTLRANGSEGDARRGRSPEGLGRVRSARALRCSISTTPSSRPSRRHETKARGTPAKAAQLDQILRRLRPRILIFDEFHNCLQLSARPPARHRGDLRRAAASRARIRHFARAGRRSRRLRPHQSDRRDGQPFRAGAHAALAFWRRLSRPSRQSRSGLPLAQASRLSDETIARAIFALSERLIGEIVGIVTRAATEAVRNGVEQITEASIEALAHVPLSRRRGSPQREALL